METKQAKNFADAAAAAGVKHAIWSTTEDPRVEVPHSSDALPTLVRPNADGTTREYNLVAAF